MPSLLGAPQALLPEVIRIPFKVVQVAAGEAHALFLTMDSREPRVFGAGNNEYGQLGLGDSMARRAGNEASEVRDLPPSVLVASVSCGGHVSMAVSHRGEVWTWGKNEESGVLGQGVLPVACAPSPSEVSSLRRKVRVVQAATTGWTSFSVSHLGKVYSWGGGLLGVHGHGHQETELWPKVIRGLDGTPIFQVAAGALHVVALGQRGDVFTWGRVGGAFGTEAQLQLAPKLVDALLGVRVLQVAAGGEHSMALTATGEVYGWGAYQAGALGDAVVKDPNIRYAFVHKADLSLGGPVVEVACGNCMSAFLSPAATNPSAFLAPQVELSADKPTEEGVKRPSGVDVWLCGSGVPATEHVAVGREGQPGNGLGGLAQALAPPLGSGRPLQLTRFDVKRVLEMMS